MVRFADIFRKKMAEESAAAIQVETKKSPFANITSQPQVGQTVLPPPVAAPKLVTVGPAAQSGTVVQKQPDGSGVHDRAYVKAPDKDVRYSQAFTSVKYSPGQPLVIGSSDVPESSGKIGVSMVDENEIRTAFANIMKTQEMDGARKALEIYEKLVFLFQMLLNRIERKISLKGVNIKDITCVINEAVLMVVNGDRGLLDLTYRASPDNYLICHTVNTSIISLEIGRGVGYNRSKLEELGLCAFLHDVGMQEVFPLIKYQDKLMPAERDRVRMHIMSGMNILKEMDGLPPVVIEVAYQHHERLTGSGYRGMAGEAINEYAKIIALADTFEAITHPRPHRPSRSGQSAIKELIENAAEQFDREALKVLVKRIGIYPVGTWVKLNTGEVARVTRVNEMFPLRPVVIVMEPIDKNNVMETKNIDLSGNHNIYISATVEETDLLKKRVAK